MSGIIGSWRSTVLAVGLVVRSSPGAGSMVVGDRAEFRDVRARFQGGWTGLVDRASTWASIPQRSKGPRRRVSVLGQSSTGSGWTFKGLVRRQSMPVGTYYLDSSNIPDGSTSSSTRAGSSADLRDSTETRLKLVPQPASRRPSDWACPPWPGSRGFAFGRKADTSTPSGGLREGERIVAEAARSMFDEAGSRFDAARSALAGDLAILLILGRIVLGPIACLLAKPGHALGDTTCGRSSSMRLAPEAGEGTVGPHQGREADRVSLVEGQDVIGGLGQIGLDGHLARLEGEEGVDQGRACHPDLRGSSAGVAGPRSSRNCPSDLRRDGHTRPELRRRTRSRSPAGCRSVRSLS